MLRSLAAKSLASLALAAASTAQDAVLAGRVLTRDGKPAASAALRLRWRVAPELPGLCGVSLGDVGIEELPAVADAQGRFRILLSHRGPFEVTASAAADRSTPRFPVMAGAFVELQLAAPVTVGGTLFDAGGAPLANVPVSLVPEFTAWSKLAAYRVPEARASTVTDAAGRFVLPFHDAYLQAGRWEPFLVLDFAVAGLAARNLELLRPTRHCRELQVQLVDAARAQARAPRSARSVPQQATAPAGNVRARLRREGAAIGGAPVLWSRLVADGPPVEVQARTDAEGNVGPCLVQSAGTLLGFVQQDGRWLPFARLAVGSEDVDAGTVLIAERALAGQVLDSTGQPIAGARVAALATEPLAAELPHVTYTDHGGNFRFAALPSGPLRVWADCGVHGFAAGQLAADARELLLRTPADGVVEGETSAADGTSMAGVWLLLAREGDDAGLMPGLRPGSTHLCVHSDGEGRVRVTGLPPGNWRIIANAVRDGRLHGGSAGVATGGVFTVTLRTVRE